MDVCLMFQLLLKLNLFYNLNIMGRMADVYGIRTIVTRTHKLLIYNNMFKLICTA